MGLYAASTLSHMFHDLAWRRFFRTLDQACIFLLIAGSFTPFAVVFLWHQWWPILLGVMWLLALFGVALVLRVRNLTPAAKITYGLLGWLPIISLKTIFDAAPFSIVAWIVTGGLLYSVGAVFLRYDQRQIIPDVAGLLWKPFLSCSITRAFDHGCFWSNPARRNTRSQLPNQPGPCWLDRAWWNAMQ